METVAERLRRGPGDWQNPEQALLNEAAAAIDAAIAAIDAAIAAMTKREGK